MMILNTFFRVNDHNFRAQMTNFARRRIALLSRVSVANQSAPTTLSTVLAYTHNEYTKETIYEKKWNKMNLFESHPLPLCER